MTVENALEAVSAMLSPKRLKHSENVAESARELALRWGEDADKAQLAGILHDICKELPERELLQWVHKSGIILDEHDQGAPHLWHAIAGSAYVREKLGVRDESVLSAIRWHTTGTAGMSRLDATVYLADLISPERDFPRVNELRVLARDALPEQAVLFALRMTMEKLLSQNKSICIETVRCYNWLAREHKLIKEAGSR